MADLAGQDADAFLATQGDVWDTPWDTFLAFSGAIASQLLPACVHDEQIQSPRMSGAT